MTWSSRIGVWLAAVASVVVGLASFDAAPAWAPPPPPPPVFVPAHEAPLQVFPWGSSRGHTFTFAWEPVCGGGQQNATLTDVTLIERPRTAARPFKFALLRVAGAIPDHYENVFYCPTGWERQTATVTTKRRVGQLTIFEAGDRRPQRRIWPQPTPPGVPRIR